MMGFRSGWRAAALLTAAICVLFLSGCGGGSGGSGIGEAVEGIEDARGRVEVYLADTPPADPTITAVQMTVTRVEANMDGTWETISTTPVTVNLTDIPPRGLLLGANTVPTGRCHQIRFFVQDATVTDGKGTHPVELPGAEQAGVVVDVNYALEYDTTIRLLLDVNAYLAFVRQQTGEYRLQPVVTSSWPK